MAASANVNLTTKASETLILDIASGAGTLYRGSVAAIVTSGSEAGKATPLTSAKNRAWGGWMQRKSPDTESEVTDATLHDIDPIRRWANLAVTGLAGTKADVPKVVWQTDDNTFTLTRAAYAYPYGVVVKHISSTRAWVRRLTASDLAQFAVNRTVLNLGSVKLVGTAGVRQSGYVVPHHLSIESTFAYVRTKETGTTASITASLWIHNGTTATQVTGGAMVFDTADAINTKIAGSTVTGANVAHEGETIQIRNAYATQAGASLVAEIFAVCQARYGT